MKNWFNNLDKKVKKYILGGTWILSFILLLLFNLVPEEEHKTTLWEYVLSFLFLVSLIFAIIFLVWEIKYNKTKNQTPLMEKNIRKTRDNNHSIITTNGSLVEDTKTETQEDSKLTNINLTFIDVETPNKLNNRICSIAIINIVDGETKFKQNLYVNPEDKFDNFNMQIHGITPKMVEKAPTFNILWQDISKFFLNSIIVGHNVQSDLSVIDKSLRHYGLKLNSLSFIDTYFLAKKYINAKSYKLSELSKIFNFEGQAHDALSDCINCKNLFNKIIKDNHLNIYSITEEYFIQHNIENKPTVQGTIKNTQKTKAYQKIQSYISVILEDNEVSNEELKSFIKMVEINNLQDTYPINKAYKAAIKKLKNKEIDINKDLSTIIGDIITDNFDGNFNGKLFCLTGDFNHGSKIEIANYIISRGGLVKDNITLKTNYLVRGMQGSNVYAYGTYGSKVKKALEMKENGNLIKIITENDIY